MQMMFFYFTLLSIYFANNTLRLPRLASNQDNSKLSKDIDDNIFYDQTYYLTKIQIEKNKEQFENEKLESSLQPSIKNLSSYIDHNKERVNIIIRSTDRGKCIRTFDLANAFKSRSMQSLEALLNDSNFLFSDDMGNLIILSLCDNLFNEKCFPRVFYLSQNNFDFFEYSISGEKFPKLKGFAVDFIKTGERKYIYLNGGIDMNGLHNPDLYRLEVDDSFGEVRIKRILHGNEFISPGFSEGSLNVINYSKEDSSTIKNLVLSFGGINDYSISNKLLSMDIDSKTINEVTIRNYQFTPRKGHSSTYIKNEKLINFQDLSKIDVVKVYKFLLFGGKSNDKYLNDLLLIQVSYMTLDDTFYYSATAIHTKGDIPEPREGHHAIIFGNYLYIFGGCNYEIKKCYNDGAYRLNLATTTNHTLTWEKIKMTDKIDINSMNVQYFLGQLCTIGSCNDYKCQKKLRILIPAFTCDCKIELSDRDNRLVNGKYFLLQCQNKNQTINAEQNNLQVMNKTLPEVPINASSMNTTKAETNASSTKANSLTEEKKQKENIYPTVSQLNTNVSFPQFGNSTEANAPAKNSTETHKKKKKKKTKKPPSEIPVRLGHIRKLIKQRKAFPEEFETPRLVLTEKDINETFSTIVTHQINPILQENYQIKKLLLDLVKSENNHSQRKQNDERFIKFIQTKQNKSLDSKNLNVILSEYIKQKKNATRHEDQIIQRNFRQTNILSNEIDSIKSLVENLNEDSSNQMKNFWNILSQQLQLSNQKVVEKIKDLESFKTNQNKVNSMIMKEMKVKCINGYIINHSSCQCLPGYTGDACDIPLTCSTNCTKHGVCQYGKCFCHPGFSGPSCENEDSCLNDCNNRGKCLHGTCFCDAMFSGNDCSILLQCENNCSNHGICFQDNCFCEPGFTGKDCSVIADRFQPCKDNCTGHGMCKLDKCFCYPGYSGPFCEIKHELPCPYDSNITNMTYVPCTGNGLCKYGMCYCYPGFTGQDCSLKDFSIHLNSATLMTSSHNATAGNSSKLNERKQSLKIHGLHRFKQIEIESTFRTQIQKIDKTLNEKDDYFRLAYCGIIFIVIILVLIITAILNKNH